MFKPLLLLPILFIACGKNEEKKKLKDHVQFVEEYRVAQETPIIKLKPQDKTVLSITHKKGNKAETFNHSMQVPLAQKYVHQKLLYPAMKKEIQDINTNQVLSPELLDTTPLGCIDYRGMNRINEHFQTAGKVYNVNLKWRPHFTIKGLDGVNRISDITYKVYWSEDHSYKKISKIEPLNKADFYFVADSETTLIDGDLKETKITLGGDQLRKMKEGCFLLKIVDFKFEKLGVEEKYSTYMKDRLNNKTQLVISTKDFQYRFFTEYQDIQSALYAEKMSLEYDEAGKLASIENLYDTQKIFDLANLYSEAELNQYNWNLLGSNKRPEQLKLKKGRTYYLVYSQLKDLVQAQTKTNSLKDLSGKTNLVPNVLVGEKIRITSQISHSTVNKDKEKDGPIFGHYKIGAGGEACWKSLSYKIPAKKLMVDLSKVRESLTINVGKNKRALTPLFINYNDNLAIYEFTIKAQDLDGSDVIISYPHRTRRTINIDKYVSIKKNDTRSYTCRIRNSKKETKEDKTYHEVIKGPELLTFENTIEHFSIR
jgi:hypothetical protein